MSESDFADPDWLVESRSNIQKLLLDQYKFALEYKDLLEGEYERQAPNVVVQDLFHFYVGAAFSLWRAVFLNDKDRKRSEIQQHARQFLELVVRDNAINYMQDKATKKWTGGYYLNNASFRIDEALQIFRARRMTAESEACSRFIRLKQEEDKPFKEAFDILHVTLVDLFHLLKNAVLKMQKSV